MRVAGLSSIAKAAGKDPAITLYGTRLTMASLDDEEQTILEDNFNKLLATTDSQVRRILEERVDTIVAGIMAIKEKLNRRKFRGLNPADMEIGFGFIRPGYTRDGNAVKAAALGLAVNHINTDWDILLTGMGNWIGFLGADADTGYVLSEDFGLVITHLVSQITPTPSIRTVHFAIGRVDLIPEDVSNIILGDNENGVAVFPIPTKIVLPEDELLVRVEGRAATDYVQLGGLVVGLGRILKTEDLVSPGWE